MQPTAVTSPRVMQSEKGYMISMIKYQVLSKNPHWSEEVIVDTLEEAKEIASRCPSWIFKVKEVSCGVVILGEINN